MDCSGAMLDSYMKKLWVFISLGLILYIRTVSSFYNESTQATIILKTEGRILLNKNENELLLVAPSSLCSTRKKQRNAIILLIHGLHVHVVKDLLKMFDNKFLDNKQTDIIFFHNGYPFMEDIFELRNYTSRCLDFVNVDSIFSRLPTFEGFDPYMTNPTFSKRSKWSYHNMIRFWFSDLLRIDIMQNVEYFVRIDDDSGFSTKFSDFFQLIKEKNAVYMANSRERDVAAAELPGLLQLQSLVNDYVRVKKIKPRNERLSDVFESKSDGKLISNVFANHFEVIKSSFFKSSEVLAFTNMILDSGGIYKYRWSDAILRYITLALFAKEEEILHRIDFGIRYCHPC